jgi:hypothetical protein
MTAAKRAGAVGDRTLDRSLVSELVRRTAEPAVTILVPVSQPAVAHPGVELQLRALVDRAVDITGSWWGPETAARLAIQLERAELRPDPAIETGHGLAIFATPDDGSLLRLPFTVDEQVVVSRTFATRQLLQGLARNPRYLVVVLDGHRAHLFQGQGRRLTVTTAGGFPVHVEPPHEQDTPHRDFPIHDEAEKEEHRIVYRAVDAALGAANRSEQLPVVVAGAERELAFFDEVVAHGEMVVGRLAGNYARASRDHLAAAVQPVLGAHISAERDRVVERVREAHGRERAVFGASAVREAAAAGRVHLLVVEEGFSVPGHTTGGSSPGGAPDGPDDLVDGVIATVLLADGHVELVADGALSDVGRIGALLRQRSAGSV